MRPLEHLLSFAVGLLLAGSDPWLLALAASALIGLRRPDLALLFALGTVRSLLPSASTPHLPEGALLWQRRVAEALGAGLTFGEGRLLTGMVIGRSGAGFTLDDYPAWREAGMAHLLVASGAQVSMLLLPLTALLHRANCSARLRATLAPLLLAQVALVLALTGLEPSILRAATLAVWTVGGTLAGRPLQPLAGFYRTALFWLLADPTLLHSASFQLSYSATWGMLLVLPRLDAVWERGEPGGGFREWGRSLARGLATITVATCAAQLTVLPVLWSRFGELRLGGFLANLVAVPLAEVVVLTGALKALLGVLGLEVLGRWLNPLLRGCLDLLQQIAEGASNLPAPFAPELRPEVAVAFLVGLALVLHPRAPRPAIIAPDATPTPPPDPRPAPPPPEREWRACG